MHFREGYTSLKSSHNSKNIFFHIYTLMRAPLEFNVVQISPMEVLTLFSKITLIQWLFLGLQALGQLDAFLHMELCTLSCECILILLELSAQITFHSSS